MIIYSRDLPSKGIGASLEYFELRPLNYKELMDYVNNDEFTKLRYLIKDLKLLTKIDPNTANASIIDAEYLLFILKILTISDEINFKYSYKCKCCGQTVSGNISSSNIIFRDIDPQYFNLYSINLGGKELYWHNVTIGEFLKFTSKIPRNKEVDDLKLLELVSMFYDEGSEINVGQLIDLFQNAVGNDIKTLMFVKAAYFDVIKPITLKCSKGGETVVGLKDLTADMFHLLLQNRRLDTSKIHFKQDA